MVVRRAPPPTDDAGEGLLDGASRRSGCSTKDVDDGARCPGVPRGAGPRECAEAVEVLCTSYLLTGIPAAASRAAVSSGVYCGMLVGGAGGGVLADGRGGAASCATRARGRHGFSVPRRPRRVDGAVGRGHVLLARLGRARRGAPPLRAAAEVSDGPKRGRGIAFVASFWMVGGVFAAALAMGLLPDDLRCDWSARAALWRLRGLLGPAVGGVGVVFPRAARASGRSSTPRLGPRRRTAPPSERDEPRVFLFLAVAFWGLYFGYYGLATWITVIVDEAHIGNTYVVALYYAAANLPATPLPTR
ncbi:hypothetical protein JL720_8496 [Aureococcus anophagefferens]|nr:hypothetical protein JL720_8496 [Aureococcus anophagefferens]